MDDLSPTQIQAALLLAAGLRLNTVAKRVGVDRTTLWNWRKTETFQRQVSEFTDANMTAARNAGSYMLPKAMRRLAEIIDADPAEAPTTSDQIAAAKLLLEYATAWHVIEPIERAKQEMEAKLQAEEHR